jgi:predicted CXXCH cytochrome family protein
VITLLVAVMPQATHGGQGPGYVQTRSPHGALNIPCQNCHTALSWKPIRATPEFDHNRTRFPLRGQHLGVACTQCHTKPVFSNVGAKCADCHADIHRGQMGARCEQCHTVNGWKVSVQAIQNHQNRFPLIGAHAAVECDACHKGAATGQFQGLSTQCYSCHAESFQQASNPNHVTSQFSTNCQQCHSMNSWLDATFDHNATGFPLSGAHATTPCANCHVNGNYNLTNTACVSCHLKDFQSTTNPNHAQQGFAQTCETCHNTSAWQPAQFDHSKTNFPLTGAHASAQCAQCHVNNNFNITNTTCVSCHLKDYQGTTNPNHAQQGIAQTCETCHNTAAWQPAQFDHTKSGFPLTGAHATLPCAQCHVNNNYNITDTTCVSCHLKDYQGATSPNHVQANIPQTCQQCHDTTSWGSANFNHASTGWPLTGAHAAVACGQCHVNGNYNLTTADTQCAACHMTDFQSTTNPNHVAAKFPTDCSGCHNTTSWQGATFNHASTGWALTGFHASVPCAQCHINGNYNLTTANTQCASCHMPDYQKTTNPNHVTAGFPTDCSGCHNTISWLGAVFNHASTGWALTGAHTTVACSQCHVNGNYSLTAANTKCDSCHMTDFRNTTNPGHVAAGFPTDCSVCHNTTSWLGAVFNHASTGWALTGAHSTVQCSQCHVNNNYSLNSTACVTCHLKDFQSATSPNHVTSGFPQVCDVCHTTTAWIPSSFNHNNTAFPLTGAHTSVPCANCHVNNNYTTVPTDCYSCHKADYTATTNPNHTAAGFPTTCATCHNTTDWLQATFNHTYFPMNHGNANGVCSTCHTNQSDYTIFTCTNCHQKTQTDNDHRGVNGYVYNSVNCYQCHRNGN